MKLEIFKETGNKIKWNILFDKIKHSIQDGNAIFIGSKEQCLELDDLMEAKE